MLDMIESYFRDSGAGILTEDEITERIKEYYRERKRYRRRQLMILIGSGAFFLAACAILLALVSWAERNS